MYPVRIGRETVNLEHFIRVVDLDDPPGAVRLEMVAGDVREYAGAEAEAIRRAVDRILRDRDPDGDRPGLLDLGAATRYAEPEPPPSSARG